MWVPRGFFSDGPISANGLLELGEISAGLSVPNDQVRLFAQDSGGTAELRVQDEAGNVTTLSPHNFSLVGDPSEPLAWSYYSENSHGRINVDMLRVVRLLEELSGETLVHVKGADGATVEPESAEVPSLRQQIQELEHKNRRLEEELEEVRLRLGLR